MYSNRQILLKCLFGKRIYNLDKIHKNENEKLVIFTKRDKSHKSEMQNEMT